MCSHHCYKQLHYVHRCGVTWVGSEYRSRMVSLLMSCRVRPSYGPVTFLELPVDLRASEYTTRSTMFRIGSMRPDFA